MHHGSGGCGGVRSICSPVHLDLIQLSPSNAGDPLGPFLMNTANYQNYVLDASSLATGTGLYPYVTHVL